MCKKLLFVAMLVGGGVYAYHHYDGKCLFPRKEQSLEAQIRKERQRLPELDGEIRKLIGQVAAREIELKNLEKDLDQTEKQLKTARLSMQAKEAELKSAAALVSDATKPNPERQRTLKELNRLADTVENLEASLSARKKQRESFRESLHAEHESLLAYKNERLALETELAQLDALVAQMRTEEIKSRVHFDRSKLADMTKRIEALRTKAEIRQKERELQVKYLGTGNQPQPTLSEQNVLERVKKLSSN